MKAVVLDGLRKGDEATEAILDIVVEELGSSGWEVESLTLRDMKIAYCLGCFHCWIKTPGVCRLDDDGRVVAGRFLRSDLAVFLTPVTFGGYSSELKRALDRIICLVSPFFLRIDGEVHHRPRYERYPRLMALGILPGEDGESERIFRTLVGRNALNMHAPAHAAGVVLRDGSGEDTRRHVRSLLADVGERK